MLTSFLIAASFLTIVPYRIRNEITPQAISNSRAYYPLIGLAVGILLLIIEEACSYVFPITITAALLTATLAIVTRGLHLDGLMDIADGLFGAYKPQERLKIMKDPHVGSFATVMAILILLLKYTALLSILNLNIPGKELAILLVPCTSRWTMVLQLNLFSYIRENGLGSSFRDNSSRLASLFAAITVSVVCLLLGGPAGVILLVVLSSIALILGKVMSKMLGGLTGDCYGATNELIETVGFILAVPVITTGFLLPFTRMVTWIQTSL
ncbi:MAG: adenosylcobinamide-GDP ribazoletransferase [Dehalococcoidia bacterium]|nr:adenosylcobinamide-GDP ribazoletransferase [Dehalococcoidia bacterium]